MDLTMPGTPPLKALRELAQSPGAGGTRVVVYSGHDDEETIAEVMSAGAYRLISKSAEPGELAVAVRAAGRA
jgi:DNA-binding NarL/FixJ family response regulator